MSYKVFVYCFRSTAELEKQLIISKNLWYVSEENKIYDKIEDVKKLITGLIKYLSNKDLK